MAKHYLDNFIGATALLTVGSVAYMLYGMATDDRPADMQGFFTAIGSYALGKIAQGIRKRDLDKSKPGLEGKVDDE